MNTIGYNAELMDAITDNYDKCAIEINGAVEKLFEAKTGLQSNYKGQGTDIVDDALEKLREHLQLLEECMSQTGKYVTCTKETAETMDNTLAESWKGQTK